MSRLKTRLEAIEKVMEQELQTQPSTPYDALAANYRSVSAARAAYLDAVEKIIVRLIAPDADSLMDVGSGDGHRAMRIAMSKHISNVVLVEPSHNMREFCRRNTQARIWSISAEELPEIEDQFAVITCLWNVLGHIENNQKRLAALKKMRLLLRGDGIMFIDVNNRYNAVTYGLLPTLGRMLYDVLAPSETNGDAQVTWRFGEKSIQSPSHFFTPREIRKLLDGAGLVVKQRFILDYRTGKIRRSEFAGQLLFQVGKTD
jgi:2-polyprenyl-3-methyl-5-hydroxy-6-metoxy-1,4-benzoquinol methylase